MTEISGCFCVDERLTHCGSRASQFFNPCLPWAWSPAAGVMILCQQKLPCPILRAGMISAADDNDAIDNRITRGRGLKTGIGYLAGTSCRRGCCGESACCKMALNGKSGGHPPDPIHRLKVESQCWTFLRGTERAWGGRERRQRDWRRRRL